MVVLGVLPLNFTNDRLLLPSRCRVTSSKIVFRDRSMQVDELFEHLAGIVALVIVITVARIIPVLPCRIPGLWSIETAVIPISATAMVSGPIASAVSSTRR